MRDGFLVRYALRDAGAKGLGVFARDPVPRGTPVWRYVAGNYAVRDEPGFRAMIAGQSRDAVVDMLTHVFGMAEFPDCLIQIHDGGVMINHDSAANLRTNGSADPVRPLDSTSAGYCQSVARALLDDRYALTATRDIDAGEELLLDYTKDVHDPPFYARLCAEFGVNEDYF